MAIFINWIVNKPSDLSKGAHGNINKAKCLFDHFLQYIVVRVDCDDLRCSACDLDRCFLGCRQQYDALLARACLDRERDRLKKCVVRLKLLKSDIDLSSTCRRPRGLIDRVTGSVDPAVKKSFQVFA